MVDALDLLRRGMAAAKTVAQMKTGSDDGLLTRKDLTKAERKAIEFAQQSYLKPSERAKTLHGYVLDEDLSNDENAVYHHSKGKVYLASRGTATAEDALVSDKDLALTGAANERVDKYMKLANQVADKYNARGRIRQVGHSLGGNIVLNASLKDSDLFHTTTAIAPGLSAVASADAVAHQKKMVQSNQDKTTILARRNDAVWSSGHDWMKGQKNFRLMKAADATLKGAANNHFLSAFADETHSEKLKNTLKKNGFSDKQIAQHMDKFSKYSIDKQAHKLNLTLTNIKIITQNMQIGVLRKILKTDHSLRKHVIK